MLAAARRSPIEAALWALALATSAYVVVGPFMVTRYAPMTDLPFHAAQSSALAHYFDPSYRFREQFSLQPLAVPYLSMYVIAALLMRVLPMLVAIKVAAISMLLLLPAGLAVMFHGMKKSPLLGMLGLGLVWCRLTHWGFLNFVGALGLFVMVIGYTLLVVDRPTRARQFALALALVALFFTHVFRFPFAVAAVVGSGLVMLPATRRFRPLLWPMVPSLVLFGAFWVRRPKELSGSMGPLSVHPERLVELVPSLFDGFVGVAEPRAVATMGRALLVVVLVSTIALIAEGRFSRRDWAQKAWSLGATAIALACAGVFFGLFFVLPMQIGDWWYVYPREATAGAFVLLGAVPDLPRAAPLRAAVVGAMAFAALTMGRVVVDNYAKFNRQSSDFAQIAQHIPKAPKLLYLVFDHAGSTRTTTPFIHLPAYVQAERGGFLSFHFAMWGASPLAYRPPSEAGAVVPPKVPHRWEWRPELFNVKTHGAFFDWFLVRRRDAPDGLFRADPSIERVAHTGTWWLYRRHGAPP